MIMRAKETDVSPWTAMLHYIIYYITSGNVPTEWEMIWNVMKILFCLRNLAISAKIVMILFLSSSVALCVHAHEMMLLLLLAQYIHILSISTENVSQNDHIKTDAFIECWYSTPFSSKIRIPANKSQNDHRYFFAMQNITNSGRYFVKPISPCLLLIIIFCIYALSATAGRLYFSFRLHKKPYLITCPFLLGAFPD